MASASALYFLFLASASQPYYDDHTFGIKPNQSSFVLSMDSGWIPARQNNFIVRNIGRSDIQAHLWYGDEVQWFGIIEGASISPGETKTLNNGDKIYYVTGLELINKGSTRAIVHGRGGDVYSPFVPNIWSYVSHILEATLKYSVKYLVHEDLVRFAFKELIHLFWPHPQKRDIWHNVLEKIGPLLEENNKQLIYNLLQNKIDKYGDEIDSFVNEMKRGLEIDQHYMHIARELVGLEKEFYFQETMKDYETINFYILPLYSNVVSMKIHFYTLGMRYKDDIKLNVNDISQIEMFANRTLNNAASYFSNITKYGMDYFYNNSQAPMIFNSMMMARSHLAIHGEEYLTIWQHKVKNPSSTKEIYNPVISYSRFFGKPTPDLYAQSTQVYVPQPLCPKMIKNKRNVLQKVAIYLWYTDPLILKIGGARLLFRNGDEHFMGTKTAFERSFVLNDTKIMQLTAFGDGRIDGLKFSLSNGNIYTFGQVNSSQSQIFQRHYHHIPSFYISSDDQDLNGQAANIAVSYQWFVRGEQE